MMWRLMRWIACMLREINQVVGVSYIYIYRYRRCTQAIFSKPENTLPENRGPPWLRVDTSQLGLGSVRAAFQLVQIWLGSGWLGGASV
jgi:hypothetical protein